MVQRTYFHRSSELFVTGKRRHIIDLDEFQVKEDLESDLGSS